MLALVLIVVSAIVLFILFYLKTKWTFRTLNHIPSPPAWPIIGHSLLFTDYRDWFDIAIKNNLKYGPLVKFWLGPFQCFLLTSDMDMVECILNTPKYLNKSSTYDFVQPWMGQGIFTCTDISLWRKRRKIVTPAFHFKNLEDFILIFNAQAEHLIKNIDSHIDGEVFNIFPHVNAYALDVICESTMGVKANFQKNSENYYGHASDTLACIVYKRVFSILIRFDILFMMTPDYQVQKKCLKFIHDYDRKIIQERRQKMAEMVTSNVPEVDEFGVKKRMAFLDILLQATIDGKPLSDQAIMEEVDTFMFGGHDTVSSAISFALYAISNHSDVQDKMVEELKTIFGNDKERLPDMRELQEMKYIEMVIKESLRCYPTTSFVGRKLWKDINYKGTILPKGLEVAIFQYQIHMNPDVYPDPEKFDPERFSDLSSQKRHQFAYIPFSVGPRNCIGQKYAMLEMKVAIAKILRKFELLPAGPGYDMKFLSAMVTKSTTGVNMRVQRRTF